MANRLYTTFSKKINPLRSPRIRWSLAKFQLSPYDALFIPGGHGPMWDLAVDKNLKKLVEDFYFGGEFVTAVCHAPAGLL